MNRKIVRRNFMGMMSIGVLCIVLAVCCLLLIGNGFSAAKGGQPVGVVYQDEDE